MAKRSYQQNCALAQAVDVIGERWSLLLVRDLLVGPRRFGELQRSLKGIGANLLSARLRDLEDAGILERLQDNDSPQRYALTKSGAALEDAVLALVRWGLAYGPKNRQGYYHQDDWDLLALKSLFQPDRAGDLSAVVQFRADEFSGWVQIKDRAVRISRGEIDSADVVVDGTIKDLFTRPQPEQPRYRGSQDTLLRFKSVFALPG